jgi:hypothetical protein
LKIGPRLREEWNEIFVVLYTKYYHLFSTFCVAWPFVVLSYSKTWSIYNTSFFTPFSFVMHVFNSFKVFYHLHPKGFFLKMMNMGIIACNLGKKISKLG